MPREIGLFPPPWISYLFEGLVTVPSIGNHRPQYYLSFEDALLAIVQSLKPDKGSYFLYPSFFCMDVVAGLERLGLKGICYAMNRELDADAEEFKTLVKEKRPSLVFVYHPMGKRSNLLKNTTWIGDLSFDSIIIEDCADCLVEDSQITFLTDRHFILDSLRKVSPFQGSRMFHQNLFPVKAPWKFSWNLFFLFAVTRLLNLLTWFNPKREWLEKKWELFGNHSDKIGISDTPLSAPILDILFFNTLNIKAIKDRREKLVREILSGISRENAPFHIPQLEERDFRELRFLPLIYPKGAAKQVADSLEASGIYIDTHFEDSPFGEKFDCLLIPLWQHIKWGQYLLSPFN